jgi:heterotetrameric sarcosine oxidase gamma subunit
MADAPQRTSSPDDGTFQVRPASARSVLRVKSWQSHRAGGAPLVLGGYELPDSVGEVTVESSRVLCTGPGEWLIVRRPADVSRLRNVWAPELSAQCLALVDLTAGFSVLELLGSDVRKVLAKSCSLDVDPRCFRAGHCARTRFAQLPVVLDCIQDPGVFELYVARSNAQFLNAWLSDAAQGLS